MDLIKKVFNFNVKQIGDETDRTLGFTGSTEVEDRDGDIIEAYGWELEDYHKNSVVMGFHEYDKFPYAKSIKTYIDYQSKELKFEVKFPTISELTSFPGNSDMIAEHAKNVDMAYNMYKNGYMSAVSVGFIGKEAEPMQDEKGNYKGRRYKKQSLLELSLVPVPSNPTALMEARSKGIISEKELKQLNKEPDEFKKEFEPDQKAGATISAKNREMMMQAMEHMQMAMDMMGEIMADKPPEEPVVESNKPPNMPMEPIMSAMRTAIAEEVKQALEDVKSQVLLLCQKDAPKDINLDAIEFPKVEKHATHNELEIKPEELKTLIKEVIETELKGGK